MPWLADGELGELGNRIYIGPAYSRSGGIHGRSTCMFAILPSGVWLDVRDVHSGGGWVGTVTRFHDAGLPTSITADVRSEISHRELAIATARAAASAPVSASDIAEATRSVDTVVVQSWLAARGQGFAGDSTRADPAAPALARVYSEPSPPAPRQDYSPAPGGCDAFGCGSDTASRHAESNSTLTLSSRAQQGISTMARGCHLGPDPSLRSG